MCNFTLLPYLLLPYYADKNEVHVVILGGGGLYPTFVHVDKGEVVKCSRLSTRGGEGVKNGQNLVHVVVE